MKKMKKNYKWRNFIGWILGVSLGCYYIPKYLFGNILWLILCWRAKAFQPYPLTSESLLELMGGILGFSGIKTAEKIMNHLKKDSKESKKDSD